jgi:hypothetical protein
MSQALPFFLVSASRTSEKTKLAAGDLWFGLDP